MQYLIIGAGPAGVNAAETLRKLDEDADIRILGDEPEPPYSRMAIPYLLMGNIEEQGTHLRDRADHFAALNIDVTQGTGPARGSCCAPGDSRKRRHACLRQAVDRHRLESGASAAAGHGR